MASLKQLSYFFLLLATFELVSSATGICQRVVSSMQTYQVYVTMSSGYTTSCYLFWRCDRTRYRRVAQIQSRLVLRSESICCEGYQGDGIICTPVCSGGCSERGMCVAPERCECQTGWTGTQCTVDIDECAQGVCSNCTNTEGSFQCSCPDGNTPPLGQASCIDPPKKVSAGIVTSRSIFLIWEAPTLSASDGNLLEYNVYCETNDNSERVFDMRTPNDSLSIPNLIPDTSYTCCIKANTTVGISSYTCTTISTLEDVPGSPPKNVSVYTVSPFAVEIEWNTPATPNGVITNYTVYNSTGDRVASVGGSQRNFVYSGLSPFESVGICVSASTAIGEGPKSAVVSNRTTETAPSIVESIEVVVVSDTSFNVSWRPPLAPNGVLTDYQLKITNLANGSLLFICVPPTGPLEHSTVGSIEPYVPYEISVRASTSAGLGDAREVVTFTKEGVPVATPKILSLQRTQSTSALIEWEALRFEDLRGNLTSYTIVYFALSNGCPSLTGSADSSSLSVVSLQTVFTLVDLLEPVHEYCAGVAATTGAGTGNFSYAPVSWYDYSMFSVEIEVSYCSQWIEELPAEKSDDLVNEITSGIEQYCQCVFPKDHITDTEFLCDNDQQDIATFEGVIIGTDERNSVNLREDLVAWAANKPSVSIQGQQVQVVNPGNNDDSEKDSDATSAAIGISIAVIIVVLLAFAVVIAVVIILYSKHKSKSYKLDTALDKRDLNVSTSKSTDDPTIKDLKNPYYDYGTHTAAGDSHTDGAYCTVEHGDLKTVREVANPTYGMTETKKGAESVWNPLYGGVNTTKSQPTELAVSSGSVVYSEIPNVHKEQCVYETSDNL